MTLEQQAVQAVHSVPKEKLKFLIEFAHFLRISDTAEGLDVAEDSKQKVKMSILGRARGNIRIAEDFNETPDCFKEYV